MNPPLDAPPPETSHRSGPREAARAVAWIAMLTAVAVVMAPWFTDLTTFGFHDWDVQTAHRYLALMSLRRYHEFPAWNPYACGGFPAWGYVEGDTILVSPFLPVYLLFSLPVAIRIEVAGMALIGAAGAYFAASRYTASHAARALVAVLWAVNGRWALQAAAGHTWHLAYAWMAWSLFFYEGARRRDRRVIDVVAAAASIAMLVYAGGIYPLPHTVLFLGLYALLLAIHERSPRPVVTLALVGALALGLSGPKLLPLLDGFGKAPRLVESTESLGIGAFFTLLTSPDQAFHSRPASVSPYGWHEWGMYISSAGVTILVLALLFVQGRREAIFKALGVLFLALGFGAFHPEAPWTLLHTTAVFRSQHVPSRFLYTAVFLLGLVAAAGIGRFVTRREVRYPWLDAGLGILVLFLGMNVARVAQKPMRDSMWMEVPFHIPEGRTFHFEKSPPFQYKRRDWVGPMYLAMLGNTGVMDCYGTPPFDRKGALPVGAREYRGEAYVISPNGAASTGSARVTRWSPNQATIEVEDAEPGARLVYNMNYDEGWHASAGRVESFKNAVAVPIPQGTSKITLSYRPPYLWTGVLMAMASAGVLLWMRRREQALLGSDRDTPS